MVGERCRSCFKNSLRVYSNCGGERAKFFIQLFLKRLHSFVEVVFGEEWVGISGVSHSLDFLCNDFS